GISAEARRVPLPVEGAGGTLLLLVASFERARSGHGRVTTREAAPGDPAAAAVEALRAHLAGGGAVEAHLADQLLVPAALLAAGRVTPAPGVVPVSRFSVGEVTGHLAATAEVVARFLDVDVAVLGRLGEPGEVRVAPRGTSPDVLPLRTPDEGAEGRAG
ncbi:MAG: RNA 3'-phosphate cyclase, partial [Anaeromyxobacteraceae bacterium]|nr:RNA 3'-phosphate cyclase [Anaeromyxobacteraceae bacterium]